MLIINGMCAASQGACWSQPHSDCRTNNEMPQTQAEDKRPQQSALPYLLVGWQHGNNSAVSSKALRLNKLGGPQ